MIRYAVDRRLMVIGEAAKHVTEAFQDEHPEFLGARYLDSVMFLLTNMEK